ncbi:MAG: DUF819 family protein [Acidobacteriota bacterium]|nr:DUF819 family protein [Acidobacteriota bacterium]MDH3528307.1 DUF819 family protein [Acidobacteriota bacterium]
MEPIFTNDAIVFGLLMLVLGLVFYTASLETGIWPKIYKFVPTLLLCYFIPALLYWPLGLIAPEWFKPEILEFAKGIGVAIPNGATFNEIAMLLSNAGAKKADYEAMTGSTNLYFVASRYLLPACLILLCISIDLKAIMNLGPKALIMFFTATTGIIIGGPIAVLIVMYLAPGLIAVTPDELWRGLSTVAGSWIGGGANQAAMKEIFKVDDNLFGTMLIVDIVVANIWMGFILYGASITKKVDKWLKADVASIEELKEKVEKFRAGIEKIPTATDTFILMGVAFFGVGLSHFLADIITPFMGGYAEALKAWRLESLASGFFWLIVVSTTFGVILSFTRARNLEGVGASRWGTIFIFVLVATIGMKMNLLEVFNNLTLFGIGLIWMIVHVILLLVVAKIIKAPFFFVAVGSQANVGGAASAPVVASAFSPALAPVGVLMAVVGYALGTYGAIICAYLMQAATR